MAEPFKNRIVRHIRTGGPLPLAEFMHWCMADPASGYYQTQTAIGKRGDFITAPEISQMFGELIGIWVRVAWQAMGSPAAFNLVELGPGRGTLMADLLRATGRSEEIANAASVHLVETSARMVELQRKTLRDNHRVEWHAKLASVPENPAIVIANEFLDVLPVRQFVKAGGQWHERCITATPEGELAWCLGDRLLDPASLPPGHDGEPEGAVYEISSARESFVANTADRIARKGGAALFIDYGHAASGFGDTFQALGQGRYADPLASPGEADLTSHVDFDALSRIAASRGVVAHPVLTQGDFLLRLGLLERAGQLGHGKDEGTQARLTAEAERLALPDQMGDLFKVFAISSFEKLWPFEDRP